MSSMSIDQTKIKVILFLAVGIFIFMLLLIGNIYLSDKKLLKEEENVKKTQVVSAYKNILKEYEGFYKNRLHGILKVPGVIEAIKTQDREKLYNIVLPKWEILKKENKHMKILHFHMGNGFSLLRVHKPEMFGDDISKKRVMCSFMHKHQKPLSGFEAGYRLQGYRVMIPIFDQNIYLGAVEIGVEPSFILSKLNNIYSVSGAVFAKKSKIYEEKLAKKSDLVIGNYLLVSNSLKDKDLIFALNENYSFESDFRIENKEKVYNIYVVNHYDFKGDVSTKTLIFNDTTKINEEFTTTIVSTILFSILFYILLIAAVKIGFEKILDKIDETNKKLNKNVAFLRSHQLAMDASSIVSKADLKGNITYVNDNFCEVTGYTKEEVLGKPHSIVRHADNSKEIFEDLWKTIKNKQVWKGVLLNKGKKGDYWVDIAILPILDENNNISEYIAVRHDITTMVKQQQKLDNAVNTDLMTGLGSRYKLLKDIEQSINPAIAIINIDRFSEINDFYGHKKGDNVIYMLGFTLSEMINQKGYKLYHLQGDEFVIFNGNIEQEDFLSVIEELITKIQTSPIMLDEEELFLNISTAISFENKEKILTTGDMALQIAKKENKRIVVYSDYISLNDEYENNMKWAKKVREAIENDNIMPVFQPIVNNTNGAFEKYEALVRLKDNDQLISPFFFLDIAKKTKYYEQITKTMIKKTFKIFAKRKEEFSINITIEDILNEDIQTFIFLMLQKYNIGSRVVFEIVESESIENFEQIDVFIKKVKSHGSKIAIDDFGTGYSNFEYLLKIKADYIKIDGSMIKDIDTNKETELVVSTIVEFANKMGMKTIAEFVENETILNKVNELGISYSQGYHFSKPITSSELL